MSDGYTPLFGSLTTGTLCGKWPDIGLWPIVLSLADRNGVVEVSPDFIARVTGLEVDAVVACMERFCADDPYSRTPEQSGARLKLIDPQHRPWGWKIVNHGKYREKARLMGRDSARTASGKDAERKRQQRVGKKSPPKSPDFPLSDSDVDRDKDKEKKAHSVRLPRGRRCPKDWQPSPSVMNLGSELGLTIEDIAVEIAKMRDWEFKDPHSDWDATARTWLRGSIERRGNPGSRAPYTPISKSAALVAEADRNLAEYRRLKGES